MGIHKCMISSSLTRVTNDHHQKMFRYVNRRQLVLRIYACAQSSPPRCCLAVEASRSNVADVLHFECVLWTDNDR